MTKISTDQSQMHVSKYMVLHAIVNQYPAENILINHLLKSVYVSNKLVIKI